MEPTRSNPLGTAPIGRLLPKFAIPSVIAFLVTSLYNIVDQIFIGQGVGYLGNAATTVATEQRSASRNGPPPPPSPCLWASAQRPTST